MSINIGIVGAGKVGCALALGFKNEGLNISGIYSRSESSCKYLSNILGMDYGNNLADTRLFDTHQIIPCHRILSTIEVERNFFYFLCIKM